MHGKLFGWLRLLLVIAKVITCKNKLCKLHDEERNNIRTRRIRWIQWKVHRVLSKSWKRKQENEIRNMLSGKEIITAKEVNNELLNSSYDLIQISLYKSLKNSWNT